MVNKSLVLYLVIAALALHLSSGQLVTPFQICEMQQMKVQGLGSSVPYDDTRMTSIREYCLKHAYDHIGTGQ